MALLEGAAPIVPATLAPGDEAPVAVWRRGSAAAILSISRDPDDEDEPFSQDIERFVKVDDAWVSSGCGDSDLAASVWRAPAER